MPDYKEPRIGQRCFFAFRAGINQFGNIVTVEDDGTRIQIRGDDGRIYTGWTKDVILL
jgi:hypothetical protein